MTAAVTTASSSSPSKSASTTMFGGFKPPVTASSASSSSASSFVSNGATGATGAAGATGATGGYGFSREASSSSASSGSLASSNSTGNGSTHALNNLTSASESHAIGSFQHERDSCSRATNGEASASNHHHPNTNSNTSSTNSREDRFLSLEKSSSTIHSNISVKYDIHATGLSVDATGSYGVLASRKGLHLIDLEAPYISTYTLHHQTKWEVVVVKCNPHVPFKSHVASTSNHNTLIWNLNAAGNSIMHNHNGNHNNNNSTNGTSNSSQKMSSSQPLVATLRAHTRPVSDLAWSPSEPMLLATCSADTKTHLWDIRTPQQPVQTFSAFTTSATQVEWNRVDPTSLATAHDGEVRVWDTRASEKAPAVTITAHMQKIYGIDWHPQRMYEIVTCSEDKTVKLWNVTQPRQCQGTLTTGAPVWRARYTPFGDGLVTISHRLDNTLRLWSLSYAHPHSESVGIGVDQVYAFSGHNDLVRAFAWRSRPNAGVYQLVSWSKSQELRMWRIDSQHLEACGYETNWMETLPTMPEEMLRTDSIHKQRASKYDLSCLKSDFQPLVVPSGATPLALCEYNFNQQVPLTEAMVEEEEEAAALQRRSSRSRLRVPHVQRKSGQRAGLSSGKQRTKGTVKKNRTKLGRMPEEDDEDDGSDDNSDDGHDEEDSGEEEDDSDAGHGEDDGDVMEGDKHQRSKPQTATSHCFKTRKERKTKASASSSAKLHTTWASCLPCPRISGACFSGPNMLVVFDSRVAIGQTRKSSGTGRVALPRTYKELLDLRDSRFATKFKKFNKKITNEMLFLYGKAPRSSSTANLSGDWSTYETNDWMDESDPSAHGVLSSLTTNGATGGGATGIGMQMSSFSHGLGAPKMTSSTSHVMNMTTAAAGNASSSNDGETAHGGSEYLKTYFTSAEFHLPVNHPDHRISVPNMNKTLSSQALPGAPLTPTGSTIRTSSSKHFHRRARAETTSSLNLDLSLSVTLLDLSTLCGVSTELMYGTLLGTSCNQSGTKSKKTGIMTTNAMTILDSILNSSNASSRRSLSSSHASKISEICALNSQRACMANRFDLSLVWCLLAATTNEFEVQDPNKLKKEPLMHLVTRWPWRMHPFGKCLVEKILQMYENIGDLPSLASIVCALDAVKADAEEPPPSSNQSVSAVTKPVPTRRSVSSSGAASKQRSAVPRVSNEWPLVAATGPNPVASSPPKANPVAENISKFLPGIMSDRVENSLRTWAGNSSKESSPLRLTVNTFVAPGNSPHQKPRTEHEIQDNENSNATADVTIVACSPVNAHTETQLSVGSDRIVLALEPLDMEDENAMLSTTPTDIERYDTYKKSYGELLYRYGAMNRRTEVLKRLSHGDKQHEGVSFGIVCPKCTQQCESLYCSFCNDFAVKCSVCQLVVRGQSMYCMSCGHGGHVTHLREWFAKENACPTGCGCWCKQATSTFNVANVAANANDELEEPISRSYSF